MIDVYSSEASSEQGAQAAFLSHLTPTQLPSPAPNTHEKPKRKPKSQPKRNRKAKGAPRSGRPSTRPWHQKREVIVNGRRQPVRRSLSDAEFRQLLGDKRHPTAADARARHMGREFTHLIVVKPREVDDLPPWERKRYWDKTLDKIHKAMQRAGASAWTFAATRESDPVANDGTGEHLNILLHLPEHAADYVLGYLDKRFSEPGELGVRVNDQNSWWLDNGHYASLLLYACKNLLPRHAYRRNVHRKKGGPICGLRAWVSQDLRLEAFLEWQRRKRA
jgi:hypothetical protein